MTKKPESLRVQKILVSLRKQGGWWTKVHGGAFQTTGLPDIIGCYEGIFYGFEVKNSTKAKVTARQALVIKLIADVGKGVSGVIVEPEDALKMIRKSQLASKRLFANKKWLTSSQACVKIGLSTGDKPISLWKLKALHSAGHIKSKMIGTRAFYSLASIRQYLKPSQSPPV